MGPAVVPEKAKPESLTDEEVVCRVRAGETALYEVIMRRYNQRLYRIARAILHNDAEAEDVMQDAYVRAYEHLDQFAGRAPFAAWLTRIAVHEALARLRLSSRNQSLDDNEHDGEPSMQITSKSPDPEQSASGSQLRDLLEEAVLDLPERYRTVIMLRDIEELSTSETADALDLTEDNVKIRLHRGHGMIRSWLFERMGAGAKEAFPFMGVRCNRVVEGVFHRLAASDSRDGRPSGSSEDPAPSVH
ncbi:MAG TPA: RNA polymerase sigma factor [Edaphobacter sp.]|jgi:RNA polymerase sigma-70 factor (ECF subfamily)|nr:RNA polymerase sigma factor [Edaphobacter sp.]